MTHILTVKVASGGTAEGILSALVQVSLCHLRLIVIRKIGTFIQTQRLKMQGARLLPHDSLLLFHFESHFVLQPFFEDVVREFEYLGTHPEH